MLCEIAAEEARGREITRRGFRAELGFHSIDQQSRSLSDQRDHRRFVRYGNGIAARNELSPVAPPHVD